MTIDEARNQIVKDLHKGTACPCCGQVVKLYKRKLYDKQVDWLIWLVGEHFRTKDWVSVSDYPSRGGDYSKLVFWNLVELKPKDVTARRKRTSGLWRPTQTGVDFVRGRVRVPAHVLVLNNKPFQFSEETVSVVDVAGESFDYSSLSV